MLAELSDGDLLSRFAATGDKSALVALIERYERMVWSVCRHALQRQQDVEDAFQQTFLVVMRKAASIHNRASFKSWLHKVARRTAKDVRNSSIRRENHEHSCDLDKQLAQDDDKLEQSDMGSDVAGQRRQFTVRLHNHTDHTVRIVGGTTSCACSVTGDLPVSIPSGGSVAVTVSAGFKGTPGLFQQKFFFYTDDKDQHRVLARYEGRVVRHRSDKSKTALKE